MNLDSKERAVAARTTKKGCVELYVYISKLQKKQLQKIAKEKDMSMSSLTRHIFSEYLKGLDFRC